MSENRINDSATENTQNRSHAVALMRFFSVDVDPEMNITTGNTGVQVPELNDLWSKGFILKIVQLVTGFVCVGIYSEGVQLLKSSINSMLFPNIVFSCFIIITGIIVLSYMLGCAMPDALIRIFNLLGTLLYFASAAVTLYEGLTEQVDNSNKEIETQRKFVFATMGFSYINCAMYGLDVYFSIKNAVGLGYEIKL